MDVLSRLKQCKKSLSQLIGCQKFLESFHIPFILGKEGVQLFRSFFCLKKVPIQHIRQATESWFLRNSHNLDCIARCLCRCPRRLYHGIFYIKYEFFAGVPNRSNETFDCRDPLLSFTCRFCSERYSGFRCDYFKLCFILVVHLDTCLCEIYRRRQWLILFSIFKIARILKIEQVLILVAFEQIAFLV